MWIKFKLLFDNPNFKKIFYGCFTVVLAIILITLPTLSIINNFQSNYIIAFNRDPNSGTREAFDTTVIDTPGYSPQHHVLEVANNDRMISSVTKNKNTIGYVSLGTIGNFDSLTGEFILNSELENDIKVLDYQADGPNGTNPSANFYSPSLTNIENGNYEPQRPFSQFFRVDYGTNEANILDVYYDKSSNTFKTSSTYNLMSLAPSEKLSYLFYEWILYSSEASKVIASFGNVDLNSAGKKNFTKTTYFSYVNLMWPTVDAAINDAKNTRIELIGSTSSAEIIKKEAQLFTFLVSNVIYSYQTGIDLNNLWINQLYISVNYQYYFSFNFNGSGDAFKRNVPGTNQSWIGYQSREYNQSEITSWGWTDSTLNHYRTNVYTEFAIDALAIIANTKNSTLDSISGIRQSELYKIYATNEAITWENIALDR